MSAVMWFMETSLGVMKGEPARIVNVPQENRGGGVPDRARLEAWIPRPAPPARRCMRPARA